MISDLDYGYVLSIWFYGCIFLTIAIMAITAVGGGKKGKMKNKKDKQF